MSTKARHKASPGSASHGEYFLSWTPQYGLPLLFDHVRQDLERIIREVAAEFESDISILHIQADRVEIMVGLSPVYSPHHFVTRIKRQSATLRNKYDSLKRKAPSLWNRHYYCNLVGSIDYKQLEQFRLNQHRKA